MECLIARFDRPRLLHQTHIRMLLDAPPVRDGSGRELRKLHDVSQQHICALKAMGQEPSPSFITSLIELKLDPTTMFEWQHHTQNQVEVPHCKELLEFLDHRAQASEIAAPTNGRKRAETSLSRKPSNHPKQVTSLAANCESTNGHCTICQTVKHPLYSCSRFRSFPHERKLIVIKNDNLCMNYLNKGLYAAQCKSLHRCHKMSRSSSYAAASESG